MHASLFLKRVSLNMSNFKHSVWFMDRFRVGLRVRVWFSFTIKMFIFNRTQLQVNRDFRNNKVGYIAPSTEYHKRSHISNHRGIAIFS